MALNKAQREQLRVKFDSRCAYCGEPLPKNWHADHLEPVQRVDKYVRGIGLVRTNELEYPQRDTIENMMPACPPCNIDKHVMRLEDWRIKLQGACGVLSRNNPTYRHAVRFGLLAETQIKIVFHFEKLTQSELRVAA